MDNKIAKIVKDINFQMREAEGEMSKLYPEGSHVCFKISSKQVTPSTGTVLGQTWQNRSLYLRVKHHQAKPGSRYSVRYVHYSDIC